MNVSAIRDADLGQTTVLLVDDDEVNLLLTSIALRERGFSITEAHSGEEALKILGDWSPDMIVLDAIMPGLDGFATCRRIRDMAGFYSTPVLMLTGLDDEASINRAYEAGATDFFVKSNQWSLLAGRLRYLLRSSRTRQELERSKAQLARAQDLARMGSFDWRPGCNELLFSSEGLRVFGLGPGDHLSVHTVLRMIPKNERAAFFAILREVLRHYTVLCTDVPVHLLDGRHRVLHLEAEPEFDEHGGVLAYNGIVQDVTDRRIAEDKIKHLANFDSLAGLPNRRQLIWRAERAIDHARSLGHQVGLLLIDLDRFKIINDTLGHAAGDELLVEVARRLRGCVRHSDQVIDATFDSVTSRAHRTLEAVGRLGGDEFVALLSEVGDERDAERVASRILEALREPVLVGGQECFVTASVGIALYPRDGQTVADLLRNSDVAMYSAKAQGRNAASAYTPQLAGKGREKLELESALHKALEREELVLHYQPKIDVRTGRYVGAEALMRWKRGSQLVPPGEFIPLAEETGLIIPMSYWAIREATRQARLWQRAFGFDAAIAVNLPSRMFQRSDLVERIQAGVQEQHVDPRCLQLEITETGLMKDLQNVIPALTRLNGIGVAISIDDFGTGYSSLAYLTTLPISEVKIDRSFVRDLGAKPESSAVVTAIIALARSLGLRVIAEGVETELQMDVLNRLGCTIMQGFLFSKPLPPGEIEELLRQPVLISAAGTPGATEADPPGPAGRARSVL
ncbi:EAL domain-containing protein [Aquabacterium sp. A7-Y]|uniref:putative bifunctional diguanylate cyclase/phosphodiesterase n=1 Tax=Aquabacterium sp. A7-Y TaxID=1349605 RepID=UPI00223E1908|nr:EAL domain-containing protein [Aquabacterium sp. A7-Y]MCW7540499.1 EAL domain-containing protein [Aquabacterium sp. A7-Y]